MSLRKKVVFLNGIQGSGKGTQLKMLVSRGFKALSGSDALRDRAQSDPEYAEEVAASDSAGTLVPDEITIGVLRDAIGTLQLEGICDLVLDGCMRTPAQAQGMLELFKETHDIVVILLVLGEEVATNRLLNNRRRPDDMCPKARGRRFKAYEDNLGGVLVTVSNAYCTVHSINADLDPNQVTERIFCLLGLQIFSHSGV